MHAQGEKEFERLCKAVFHFAADRFGAEAKHTARRLSSISTLLNLAAKCRGVQPSLSLASVLEPAASSLSTVSKLELGEKREGEETEGGWMRGCFQSRMVTHVVVFLIGMNHI